MPKVNKHIFLCCDQTKPKCCHYQDGMASWEFLKKYLKAVDGHQRGIERTKANCLRICSKGPVAVVYPEGIWYQNCTPEALKKIVDQHLLGGVPVAEYLLIDD